MASEIVDPIDLPLLPTIQRAVPPELHVLHDANAGYKSQDLVAASEARTRDLRNGRRRSHQPTAGIECLVVLYHVQEHVLVLPGQAFK